MPKAPTNKPRLAIAGPGAGKTHTMVDEIVNVLPSLEAHQYLAAITFTNAAADNIRERLQMRTQLARNVFVGTTHTFVNRFILAPCATLFEKIPEDRIFAAIDIHEKGQGAAIYAKNLIKKGIVPFASMVSLGRELLKIADVRTRVSNRLAYMFIDEFQDTDIGMLEIFDQIRKVGNTAIYAVGDPQQFVMGFTYRGTPIPQFDKLPFFRFEKAAAAASLVSNHRSVPEIVEFANQFRTDLQQRSVRAAGAGHRVLFLTPQPLRDIVHHFREHSKNIKADGATVSRLYLANENAAFQEVLDEFEIQQTSGHGHKSGSALNEALELLATSVDRSQLKACRDLKLSRLQWRSAGIEILRAAAQPEFDVVALAKFVRERFDHKVASSRSSTLKEGITQLKTHLAHGSFDERLDRCASIRKAKGLEADAVLALAKGTSELAKWLETDQQTRISDRQDICRVGYVAFTRPRELLCIACLKPIDNQLKDLIESLRIHIV